MTMTPWILITNFGDSAVMMPAAVTIALWLAASGAWRASLAWLVAFGTGSALVMVTKIAFMGWGIGSARLDFTGISGHTMLATSISLTAVFLVTRGLDRPYRLGLMAVGLAAAMTVAKSRLALEAHSTSEVCAGLLIGILVATGFAAASRPLPRPKLGRSVMVAALLLIGLFTHGHQAGAQGMIVQLSLYLSGHEEVYTRALFSAGGIA
jgi:membrane-associated phospholipid phosphatase